MAIEINMSAVEAMLNAIADSATTLHVVNAYTLGDAYATVNTNTVITYTLTVGDGNGDYTISTPTSGTRRLTIAAQSGGTTTADTGATPDLHYVLTNGTDTVYYATDETSDAVVSTGAVMNTDAFYVQTTAIAAV